MIAMKMTPMKMLFGCALLGVASALVTHASVIKQSHVMVETTSTGAVQEFFDKLWLDIDNFESDADKGADLGLNLVASKTGVGFETGYEGNDEVSSLADYCAGSTEQNQNPKVGEKVMCDWEGYGPYYPGKVTKTYADGTYKIKYDDGFTEDHVPQTRMRALTEEEKKKHMKKVKGDPACKFQDLVKKVKPKIEELEKNMAMWCTNQRASLAGKETAALPPPPKHLREGRQAAAIKGNEGDGQIIEGGQTFDLGQGGAGKGQGGGQAPSGIAGVAPAPAPAVEIPANKQAEIEGLKKQIAENDAYIGALKEQESEQASRLEEFALDFKEGVKDAVKQGVKTVDDLIKEYKDRIAAQQDEIARRLKRIEEQAMELARLGAHKIPLEKIEVDCSALEHEVKDAWDEMQRMDHNGELDPDLRNILDGIMKPIRSIRGRINHLMGLEKMTLSIMEKEKDEANQAAEAAKAHALKHGANAEEAAKQAEIAANEVKNRFRSSIRQDELNMLDQAQGMTSALRTSNRDVKELDFGLHPQGAKWWRYRYEHAYVEAWLMICVSILMLIWRKIVQEVKYVLEIWALPHGVTRRHVFQGEILNHPGRDDGSLFMVWLSCLSEMMLTCILVFITIWIICKTTLVDYLPFAIVEGDLNMPVSGDQYRKLAIDCSSIYFFAIFMYFLLIFPIAHDAKSLTHKIANEFEAVSPRMPLDASPSNKSFKGLRSMAAEKGVGTMAHDHAEFAAEKQWFIDFMEIALKDRKEAEALKLNDMFGGKWNTFPFTQYLIVSVHMNVSCLFEFLWMVWLPFVICFVLFSGLHRFWHMGYVRIMMFFTAFTFALLFTIAWFVRKIARDYNKQPEDVKVHPLHTSWHTEAIVLKLLQFSLFFQCYGVARMICHPWMWELHFWPVLWLTILAVVLMVCFNMLVSPSLPSFCAVMAMPPYVNPQNMRVMVFAAENTEGAQKDAKAP